jgi:hypothetical protein
MSFLRIYVIAVFAFLLAGCATTIQLQIKRAPELNLVGVKKLKIEPFGVSGSLSLDNGLGGGGILGAVIGMAVDAGASKIAEEKHPGLQAAELLGIKQTVYTDGYYTVTEGQDYDAVVTGAIHYEVRDSGGDRQTKDDQGRVYVWYQIDRTAEVRVQFSVADKTGKVIGASQVYTSVSYDARGENRQRAFDNAAPWESMVQKGLTETQEPFIRKIAPYFVTERRTFENGESEAIKEGNKAAGAGNWDTAVELWQQGRESGAEKDQIAALYNLGIYDEVEGRLADALKKFETVQKMSGEAKYAADIKRTQTRIDEAEQMRLASAPPEAATKPQSGVPAPPAAAAPQTEVAPSAEPDQSDEEIQSWETGLDLRVVRKPGLHQFNWSPLASAAGYHVYAAKSKHKSFHQLNHNLLKKSQLRVKALPRGQAYVQVVAFDADGVEIARSAAQKLVLH